MLKTGGGEERLAAVGTVGYRPEVDGLRAIAVIVVILFHARIAGFGGGFLGVDVFFVLSGYLITGIISRELASGSFSIGYFYQRRIRRIIPAPGAGNRASAAAHA